MISCVIQMVAVFRSSTSMQWFQQDQELTEVCEKRKNREQGEKFKTEIKCASFVPNFGKKLTRQI